MAYRDDLAALEARVAALSDDVAERTRERDEAARMLDEARARAHAEAYLADLAAGGPALRRRKRLRIAAITAGLAMIVGGLLAYRVRAHRDDRFDEAMQKLEQFTGDMCQCKDSSCVTHVSDAMTRWSTEIMKDWKPEPKFSEGQMKRAEEVARHMAECMQKAMAADYPPQATP